MYTRNVRQEQQLGVYFFMVKFSREEKIMSVRSYLDGNDGVKRRAKSIEVYPIVIQQLFTNNKDV